MTRPGPGLGIVLDEDKLRALRRDHTPRTLVSFPEAVGASQVGLLSKEVATMHASEQTRSGEQPNDCELHQVLLSWPRLGGVCYVM